MAGHQVTGGGLANASLYVTREGFYTASTTLISLVPTKPHDSAMVKSSASSIACAGTIECMASPKSCKQTVSFDHVVNGPGKNIF